MAGLTARGCRGGLLALGGTVLAACGRRASRSTGPRSAAESLGTGVALSGLVWPGGDAPAYDGVVVVGADGRVAAMGPTGLVAVPEGVRRLGGPGCWVGPGIVDTHVHLAFGGPEQALRGGLVGVRDLGAPPARAQQWRTAGGVPPGSPAVAVVGPLLTAPGGYPSESWGADGFARAIDSPAAARTAVADLVADGVDLVKLALEPSAGQPVPEPAQVRAVVAAAHEAGLRVTAHALTAPMVARALDAGVDELAHTPLEPLDNALVQRLVDTGTPVVSTLQTFFCGGQGLAAATNAATLLRAGVELVYGTDLGNAGTRPGVDPRELDRLAAAGLGRLGALRAATEGAARLADLPGRTGRLQTGQLAALVLLPGDPAVEPGVWRSPSAVLADRRLVTL